MKKTCIYLASAAVAMMAACGRASLEMPAVFSDNMVLQQQRSVPIWGKTTPRKKVTILPSWSPQTYSGSADDNGNWKIIVPTPIAGGPHTIIVKSGRARDTLRNVMTGEVWLCSGQSNMEMPLAGWGKVINYRQEITAAADYPDIRFLKIQKKCHAQPQPNLEAQGGGWQVCSPDLAADFSAVAYLFGRGLHRSLNGTPIGLIDATWGGTIIEAWTSAGALKTLPDLAAAVEEAAGVDYAKLTEEYTQAIGEWDAQFAAADKGIAEGKPLWASPDFDDSGWQTMTLPAMWETSGLPDFDGIVWFRLALDIPETWAGSDLVLNLAEIDDSDIAYFNGEQIGATSGFDVPRKYLVPARLVKKGKNLIAVRVADTGGEGGIYGAAAFSLAQSSSNQMSLARQWRYCTSADLKALPPRPASPNDPNRPAVLYNAMIAPIVPFTIRGAIWYQGEANAARPEQYRTLFPLMINDWRENWGYAFPFYFVQLAGFAAPQNEDWPMLREAQMQALQLINTGMAVALDIGNDKDIHPKNKQEVARRLALWAKAKTYGISLPSYSGPLYKSHRIDGGAVRIAFDHAVGGLTTNDGGLWGIGGFTIAGADGVFYDAQAKIEGGEVVVRSPKVAKPTAVRYAWTDVQGSANLCNGEYLPASPFRTDTDSK